ncbi:hypothetical protein CBR_g23210 [Chara braunii]|uniref:Uncharacterized protein n=1 Tax=Chara braunii TaxID=69332 RepID=A0A388JV83_CHABU|nr:hypothetical protein CBR_g23210 [Chara braunii]|eukprot:GBG61695.1 hypothetical protein CBR_g23210 [Chara braunii]
MQDQQTAILQDIQESLAVLVGRAQAAPSLSGPGVWPIVHPPPFVPPVTGISPYTAPASVQPFSLGMPLTGGFSAGPSLEVPVQTVFSQPPSKVVVSGQPAVSQPAQLQGSQPQQIVQQPAPQGPQSGLVQVQGQSQWIPKTTIAAHKPSTGDKRGEDLDTWLRAVPVYVKCKLTLPHEEVLVATSYLEGSAARWLSGLVQLQGYGHDFRAWAVTQKLDDFLKLVEDRWHDPQEAHKATDTIPTLHTRQFKSVREATDAVERLICVPGFRYDPQVLLTSYLRCFPMPLRNQLVGEANINMHNFTLFSKKALDLEAKIGHVQTPTTDGGKKTLPPNWKAKVRIMFVDNDGLTIELDDNFQEGVGLEAGSVEASGGRVVAAVAQKGKATGRRRGVAFYNYYKQNPEEGMYLVYVSAAGELVKMPPEIEGLCELPFAYFSDPSLMPILYGTILAACYGCDQNRDVVERELSMQMVLSFLRSCREDLTCQQEATMTSGGSKVRLQSVPLVNGVMIGDVTGSRPPGGTELAESGCGAAAECGWKACNGTGNPSAFVAKLATKGPSVFVTASGDISASPKQHARDEKEGSASRKGSKVVDLESGKGGRNGSRGSGCVALDTGIVVSPRKKGKTGLCLNFGQSMTDNIKGKGPGGGGQELCPEGCALNTLTSPRRGRSLSTSPDIFSNQAATPTLNSGRGLRSVPTYGIKGLTEKEIPDDISPGTSGRSCSHVLHDSVFKLPNRFPRRLWAAAEVFFEAKS